MPSDNSATGTIATDSVYRGRFAPSPSGDLHFGSLLAALISYLDAKSFGGSWHVRVENIDPPREPIGAAQSILAALTAHGFESDEPVRFQMDNHARHQAAIDQLLQQGDAYYCQCSRRKLGATGLNRYPGTCRTKGLTEGSVRCRVPDEPVRIFDRWQGRREYALADTPGDFIIKRKDGLTAYQLAVVVDDAHERISDVVRGIDLFDSTPRQRWLQFCLGLPTPRYAHFPVLVDHRGDKLSKQAGAIGVDINTANANLLMACRLIGLNPPARLSQLAPAEVLAWAQSRYVASWFRDKPGSIQMADSFSSDLG